MDATTPNTRSLPKANLHLHLVGAMRRQTLIDLALRRGAAPARAEIRQLTQAITAQAIELSIVRGKAGWG